MTPTTTESEVLTDGVLTAVDGTRMRTTEMPGVFPCAPVVGKCFRHYDKPLTEGANIRVVQTSPVVEVAVVNGVWEFKTANSTYRLRVIPSN